MIPNAYEIEFLELTNEARADPPAYGRRIGLDLSGYAPTPPMMMHRLLVTAARLHSRDMADRLYVDHLSPDTPPQSSVDRMKLAGYFENGSYECVAGQPGSPSEILKAFIIDEPFSFTQYGHRKALLGAVPYPTSDCGVGMWEGIIPGGNGFVDQKVNYVTVDMSSPMVGWTPGPDWGSFVDSLWLSVLQRRPRGKAAFQNLQVIDPLSIHSSDPVANSKVLVRNLETSAENIRKEIEAQCVDILGRLPRQPELTAMTAAFTNVTDLRIALECSQEYLTRTQSLN